MRKIILAICLFCFFAYGALAVVNSNEDASFLVASAEAISPNPVEPGQDFTIDLNIYNHGKSAATNAKVELLENKVFRLTGKEANFDNAVTICSSCSKSNIYYLTVAPDAVSGEYPIIFRIWDSNNVSHEDTFYIRVIGQPDIIFDAETEGEISPDSSFDATFTVKNVGTGTARNIKLVPSTQGFVFKGTNLLFLEELKPGQKIIKKSCPAHIRFPWSRIPGTFSGHILQG